MIIAGDKRDFSKSIIESIAYSVLNFAVLSWLIIIISSNNFSSEHQFFYWLGIVSIFIIFPALWPFLFVRISKFDIFKNNLLEPTNQPWDSIFNKRESYWVKVHLKNNSVIYGKYALKSSASAYPKERQIYLEALWNEGKNGWFGKKVKRTKGVILFESEISHIEFYK